MKSPSNEYKAEVINKLLKSNNKELFKLIYGFILMGVPESKDVNK